MVKKCPECGDSNIEWMKEKGEIVCRSCGLVIDDKLVDFTQEWREFGGEDEGKRRSGAPLRYTEFDQGLSTQVGMKSDLSILKGKNKSKFFRLRTWQNRVSSAIERNLKQALSELKRLSSFLKMTSQIEEEAARLYMLSVQRGLVRGRSMESVVAGCLYASCRRFELPRSLDEIAEAANLEKKEVGRTYRFVIRELELKIIPSNPLDYIPRLISILKLDPKTQSLASELVQKTMNEDLASGKTPNGIAASAIYVAAVINGNKKTQREVAGAAGITEVTIRNRYKEMERKLNLKDQIYAIKKKSQQERDKIKKSEKKKGKGGRKPKPLYWGKGKKWGIKI
jgi:transcription initiation factor TFIIB